MTSALSSQGSPLAFRTICKMNRAKPCVVMLTCVGIWAAMRRAWGWVGATVQVAWAVGEVRPQWQVSGTERNGSEPGALGNSGTSSWALEKAGMTAAFLMDTAMSPRCLQGCVQASSCDPPGWFQPLRSLSLARLCPSGLVSGLSASRFTQHLLSVRIFLLSPWCSHHHMSVSAGPSAYNTPSGNLYHLYSLFKTKFSCSFFQKAFWGSYRYFSSCPESILCCFYARIALELPASPASPCCGFSILVHPGSGTR